MLRCGCYWYSCCNGWVLFACKENALARVFVEIVSVDTENSIVYANNVSYALEYEYDYDIPCDIICNDIVISPELNGIKFDYSTGTIYCRELELTNKI